LAGGSQQGRKGENVKTADAVVVRQTALWAHAEAVRHRFAGPDRAERAAAAQVAGDDPHLRVFQELGHPLADVAVAGAVETPALDAVVLGPFVRDSIMPLGRRDGLVKGCLE